MDFPTRIRDTELALAAAIVRREEHRTGVVTCTAEIRHLKIRLARLTAQGKRDAARADGMTPAMEKEIARLRAGGAPIVAMFKDDPADEPAPNLFASAAPKPVMRSGMSKTMDDLHDDYMVDRQYAYETGEPMNQSFDEYVAEYTSQGNTIGPADALPAGLFEGPIWPKP